MIIQFAMKEKRGQISVEYLVVISFVTFIALSVLGVAIFYSAEIQDAIKMIQVEQFSQKVISSAESIFYSGEPARITITAYLPRGINSIDIDNKDIIFEILTSSGITKIAFSGNVPMEGNIPTSQGVKTLQLIAQQDKVLIQLA